MSSPILRMDCIDQKDAQALYGPVENLQEITALIQGTPMADIHGIQNAASGMLPHMVWTLDQTESSFVYQNKQS